MSAPHFDHLLGFFKALADENRLKMAILVSQRKYSAGELADVLNLTAPTVSHHLSKLREAGLVNLNVVGNTHYYKLNTTLFEAVKTNLLNQQMMGVMNEHILSAGSVDRYRQKAERARAQAEAWLADLDVNEYDRKVLRDYTEYGRLTTIPSRYKKLLAVLRWLATKFAPGVKYTEGEVNAILKEIHPDYARLRRELIEAKFLQREGGGGMYWRSDEAPVFAEADDREV
jgi:predicted transcriptional regulator